LEKRQFIHPPRAAPLFSRQQSRLRVFLQGAKGDGFFTIRLPLLIVKLLERHVQILVELDDDGLISHPSPHRGAVVGGRLAARSIQWRPRLSLLRGRME
jgi:hypothetical protein